MPTSPVTTPPQDITTSTDDVVQSRKTFKLFRKTTSKKKVTIATLLYSDIIKCHS